MATLKLRHLSGLIVPLFFLTSCGSGGSTPSDEPVTITPPVVPPTVGTPEISSIEIVNATNQNTIQQVSQNSTIDVALLPDSFNFVAVPQDETAVESVEFVMDGCTSIERTEIFPPYSLQDESIGLSTLPEGECSITATPYSEDNLAGEAGPDFTVSFEVVDNSGGSSNSIPTIELIGSATVSVPFGGTYNELGWLANDAEDGDLTSTVQVQGDNINTLIAGTFLITYLVTDSAGASASIQRSVIVESSTGPQITLIGPDVFFIELNDSFTDPGATAFDQEDGNISANISINSNVNTSALGTYEVVYTVSDSDNQTVQATREVVVTNNSSSSGDISADIVVTTRMNGVSPEIVQFDAMSSTCSGCTDVFGQGTNEAIAWSELAYAFDFDDSDSGNFSTTGNSRNTQAGSSPIAAHTFHCYGESDPNWDATDERCEFNVGVRVQAKDSDFSDAFVRVNVQQLYGVGGYYQDADIYCVSSTGDYSWCPHNASARHVTDTPNANQYDGRLYIFDNDGGTYDDFCPDAEQKNAVAIAYGPNIDPTIPRGSRPYIREVMLGSRVGNATCVHTQTTSTVASLADDMPARNSNGDLINGWGFGQKVVGLATGATRNGMTTNFTHFVDISQDQYNDSSEDGEFDLSSSGSFCIPQNNTGATIQCSDMPYQSMMMIADSVIVGNCNGTPPQTVFSSFGVGAVQNVFLGVDTGCADQHVMRLNGSYKTIFSNVYLRGNAGIPVPSRNSTSRGSGVTQRPVNSAGGTGTGGLHDQNKDPTDLTGNDHRRSGFASGDFWNRYNVFIDSVFNDPIQHPSAQNGFPLGFGGWYSAAYGNVFQNITSGDSGLQDMRIYGRFITVRNTTYSTANSGNIQEETWYTGTQADCSADSYHCTNDIHVEGSPNGATVFRENAAPLSVPNANWRP